MSREDPSVPMTPFEESQEIAALRDEVRYLRRRETKAIRKSNEAMARALGIERPNVEVRETGSDVFTHRVYVNDVYIDGYERLDDAERIAIRLREAFAIPISKKPVKKEA